MKSKKNSLPGLFQDPIRVGESGEAVFPYLTKRKNTSTKPKEIIFYGYSV